ncbi:MAG: hypothetical protein LQ351_001013 [Letrouitia transgressa]|nr:MAG: hypothetical protein LQ351_001013 [Letrouitia transgressa]
MEKETWFPGHPTSANQPDTRVAGRDDSPTDPPGRKPVWSWKRALCPTLSSHQLPILKILQLVFLLLLALVRPSASVSVDFENCLSPNIVNSKLTPKPLQFIPQYAWSKFDTGAPSHNLNVTVYGDIDGLATNTSRPTDDDERWQQPNVTLGKIVDEDQANDHRSTFFARFNVLDYTPYDAPASAFCENVIPGHQPCPLIPIRAFNKTRRKVSATDPADPGRPAFTFAHDMYSSFRFTSISATLRVTSGDANKSQLACVSLRITPDLGTSLSGILQYLPLVVLCLVAIATASAAVFSPWGSTDVFRFTSNYGRDADLLRLVTPGFGDCLQYIQFIVLAGSLSLNYPGFFQPVVSQVSWSTLMFNQSFVSHGNGTQSLVDGIYRVKGNYGLDRMSQLVGMTKDEDLWAGMMVWLLVIIAAVIFLIQVGFGFSWGYRILSNTQQEDLRAKNLPFTVGNAVRIVFNYFLLPIVGLSMYQLVIAGHSPAVTPVFAGILLLTLVAFAAFLLWLIATTHDRSTLFDDLPTVLLYGPLYNTYSDNAAAFALVPVMLTFIRGIAIGAVQPSGIAQLILLAICEVITILTLNAFRPFHSPTSMNAFHTFFAAVRLVTILLSVAFVPTLGIDDAPRGWVGYVILLLHAIVLVFGFFLNACQTLIEVVARLAGAGGDEGVGRGVARGGLVKVFGMRQLSRRNTRLRGNARHSVASDAAILGPDVDQKSIQLNGGRSRSVSASSAVLLNRQGTSDPRRSVGIESISAAGTGNIVGESSSAPYTPVASGGASAFSYLPGASQKGQGNSGGAGIVNLKAAEAADPYFRPPRARRATLDPSPTGRSRGSWVGSDWQNKRWSQHSPEREGPPNASEWAISGRGTPIPAHLGRDRAESDPDDPRRSKTDYATREVDFYYGVRGPALSSQPTRRLKTGPADPTKPTLSASGWIKSLFGGKVKDRGKGFEVVRSSRALPPGQRIPSGEILDQDGRYLDDPESAAPNPPRNRDLELSDDGDAIGGGTRHFPEEEPASPTISENNSDDRSISDGDWDMNRISQVPQFPPSLPSIETGGGIELPSRVGSKVSSRPIRQSTSRGSRPPPVQRKSSKRDLLGGPPEFDFGEATRLSTVTASPPVTPQRTTRLYNPDFIPQQHLRPPETSNRLPFDGHQLSPTDSRFSTGGDSANSSVMAQPSDDNEGDGSGHARHPPSVLGVLAPDIRQDRPSSLGYVQQHRASDHIHTASPDDPPLLGSSAELIGDLSRRELTSERKKHRE